MGSYVDLSASERAERDALAGRVLEAAVGTFDLVGIYLGERLGLFRSLAEAGPLTPPELAVATGLHERYVREWLEHAAVGGIVAADARGADPSTWRYALPRGRAAALLDRDDLGYATPTALAVMGAVRLVPRLLEVFRSGGGFPTDAAGADMREGEALTNRPQYLSLLGSAWLPAIPAVDARLRVLPPARILDIGAGEGWSSIGMAVAYPRATVDGIDLDVASVDAARRNAAALGVAGRVRFEARDASEPGLSGAYDLATAFECIHDMTDPVGALRAMRAALAPGGMALVADDRADETFQAPGDLVQRFLYGWSIAHCLPSGMAGPDPAGTGAVMRPATFRRYAADAGFASVEVLEIDHDLWWFYLLRP
jgi:SAM-dependent methyltransferase